MSEEQLQLLIGMGRDPVTGDPLGHAYPVYSTPAERIEARVEALDPELGPASRAEAIAQIEDEERKRGTRNHANGKTRWSKGKILDGQPEGYWEWYRVDGTIKRSGHFSAGGPVGEWVTYDKNGEPYKTTDRGGTPEN